MHDCGSLDDHKLYTAFYAYRMTVFYFDHLSMIPEVRQFLVIDDDDKLGRGGDSGSLSCCGNVDT
ncbi:hypothetical protein C5S53_15225 [Methanophagales archaeon]|nr:hypothetical protein C5S53_15225 [Methanophagales archaeon]